MTDETTKAGKGNFPTTYVSVPFPLTHKGNFSMFLPEKANYYQLII